MFKRNIDVTISGVVTINFPALEALVSYLQNEQQKQVDELTAQVAALTKGLSQPTADLQAAEQQAKQS